MLLDPPETFDEIIEKCQMIFDFETLSLSGYGDDFENCWAGGK